MVGANTAPGAGHAERTEDQLGKEERRLRLWAEATSPYGLGLPIGVVWKLSPREYLALQKIREQHLTRWAIEQSMFANAHFRGKDDVGFTPDDFMGKGNREQRQREFQRSQIDVMRANAALGMMKKGDVPDNLPDWAR